MSEQLVLEGIVEDIVYSNAENGYTVLNMSVDNSLITAVGIMPSSAPGEKLKIYGSWKKHPTFGTQFAVDKCERSMPETVADMYRYLAGGAIKGIGPATANKIVEQFGTESFEIIENHPERLSQIRGITRGGDFTYRGSKEKYEMDLVCPCKSIHFHLKATPINRDENGKPLPNAPRPQD